MTREKPALNRTETMRALKFSNWDAIYATLFATLTGGAFLTGFSRMLKINDFWMGVIFSFPMLAGIPQIVSSYIVERRGERKKFCILYSLIGRGLFIPIIFVPFILPTPLQFPVFVLLYLFSNIFLSITLPAWSSWMSDLVPSEIRGRYFGQRNMLAGLTVIIISLPAGWFIDLASKYHRFPEKFGFAVLFSIAVICALLSTLAISRQAEPKMIVSPEEEPGGLRGAISFYRIPFRDRNFRRLVIFGSLFAFAQFFASPFFLIYQLEQLKFTYTIIQIMTVYTSLLSMLSMPLWGYLGDKFGNKPIIAISVVGVAFLPIIWDFTTYKHIILSYVLVTLINTAGGIFWAGVGLGQFNILIASTPTEKKSVYFGAWSALVGLIGGIAPIIGGTLMTTFKPIHFQLWDLNMGNYQIVFFINTLLRFAALWSLGAVREAGSASARVVLSQLGSAPMGTWFQIRKLQHATSEDERRQAAQSLRTTRTVLAVDELISALEDPSLHVREEAAEALGEIGDKRATNALIAKLKDSSSGVVQEAADALGRIGDPVAVPALADILEHGETIDQLSAARALGKIASLEAVDILLKYVQPSFCQSNPEIAEVCIRALGNSHSPASVPTLAKCLEEAPRSMHRAVVRSLGEMGSRDAAQSLIKLLRVENEPAMLSRIAVSLAMCDAEEAVPELLETLKRLDSPIARKQVLNAIGNLLGEGEWLYPLLAMEPYERDQAVTKMLNEMIRKERSGAKENFASKRRWKIMESSLQHYQSSRYNEAAQALLRLPFGKNDEQDILQEVLNWSAKRAQAGEADSEEFLLVLLVLRRRLSFA
jgi:HEAT repeat protein/Na+/melibiose symporter-like transporter